MLSVPIQTVWLLLDRQRKRLRQFAFPKPPFAPALVLLLLLCGCSARTTTPTNTTADKSSEKTKLPEEHTDAPKKEGVENAKTQSEIVKVAVDDHPSEGINEGEAVDSEQLQQLHLVSGSWTTRRLIGLAPTGPAIVDFSVSIDGVNLEESTTSALKSIADELLGALSDSKATWDLVLTLPLVRSGWLGNLAAEGDQQSQLISMYDVNRDGEADIEELLPFLSRGLSRTSPFLISDGGTEPAVGTMNSVWGIADLDDDNALDAAELSRIVESIKRLDVNGDGVIARQEVAERQASQTAGMMQRTSLLQTTSLLTVETEQRDVENLEASKSRRKTIGSLLRHYTFLETVPRDQWSDWSDLMWNQLDADKDQLLEPREAEAMLIGEPHAKIFVRLPALISKPEGVDAMSSDSVSGMNAASTKTTGGNDRSEANHLAVVCTGNVGGQWNAHRAGGRLTSHGFSLRLQIEDGFSSSACAQIRQQMESALSNPQLGSVLRQQLGLAETAFELADSDGNQKLSDAEFEKLWGWLSLRQGMRLVARWTVANDPWFQLGDIDGDGRLTEFELSALQKALQQLDRDQDGRLTPYEQPLLVNLEISRSDSRLVALLGGAQDRESQGQTEFTWFSAMDTNNDGVLNRQEFLGSRADFERFDRDKDGFVALGEVYLAP